MREIIFRGMMTTGKWVYGQLAHDLPNETAYYKECSSRICWHPESGGTANAPVKNGTVGQYINIDDCNGEKLYEGDKIWIIRGMNAEEVIVDMFETRRLLEESGGAFSKVGTIHDQQIEGES